MGSLASKYDINSKSCIDCNDLEMIRTSWSLITNKDEFGINCFMEKDINVMTKWVDFHKKMLFYRCYVINVINIKQNYDMLNKSPSIVC